jgi:hypothetical protein
MAAGEVTAMARELRRIGVSGSPELLRLAEEVHATGEARVLQALAPAHRA